MPDRPQYTDAQLRQIADGYYTQVLAPSSGNVPPEAMVLACQMMIAACLVAIEPAPPVLVTQEPQPSPSFSRGLQIGNEIAGMVDKIRAHRTGQAANEGEER